MLIQTLSFDKQGSGRGHRPDQLGVAEEHGDETIVDLCKFSSSNTSYNQHAFFNVQITAHLFHGRLLLNIRICCNYPEISSPWLSASE